MCETGKDGHMIPCVDVKEALRDVMRKYHHSPEVMVCVTDSTAAVGFRVEEIPNPAFYGHADTEHVSGCKVCEAAEPNTPPYGIRGLEQNEEPHPEGPTE